ncbi:MAG: tRNA 5-methylaminomethyl-2-thiouridine synthase [Bradyrhizobium sp.]|nr:tRNA 5-methylaminomethyl-2-thiouridine synthase [Bradyrhizobium sp.]
MTRYFFQITNGKPHNDETGEELRDDKDAWLAAKRLARDIEDTLEPDGSWNVEVRDSEGPIYSIKISARCLRDLVR